MQMSFVGRPDVQTIVLDFCEHGGEVFRDGEACASRDLADSSCVAAEFERVF